MVQQHIRNIAIIAHVDHGKTTLVDQLFHHSGQFRSNQVVNERLMDSGDLERERGITISSKNGSFTWKDHRINIIDTPGHADFGGQVERVLQMADGALLLVDAAEGPMPQTYFVVKKALANNLPLIVVVNKIDKPAADPESTVNKVFDLLAHFDAPDHILDFPVVYASAKSGFSSLEPTLSSDGDMAPLLDAIVEHLPPPSANIEDPLQLQICSISYSPYLGRLGIGKLTGGSVRANRDILLCREDGRRISKRLSKIFAFQINATIPVEEAKAGDIIAVGGIEDICIGETITDPQTPRPLPVFKVDPPTLSMRFMVNSSPKAGTEGTFVTGSHLAERLEREQKSDVALYIEPIEGDQGFIVSGRGELHLSILIETMRREGYEFEVCRPQVIEKEIDGVRHEPFERVSIEVSPEAVGSIIESMAFRKGEMKEMDQHSGDLTRLEFLTPTRGLLGFKSVFMTLSKGMGVFTYSFDSYKPYAGDMRSRQNGVLVSKETAPTIAFALFNLQARGKLFVGPGEEVYRGQLVGEHSRDNDLLVNPAKGKKLTNMRAAGSDDSVILTPPTRMSLEEAIVYIEPDERVEITPKAIRLRKTVVVT